MFYNSDVKCSSSFFKNRFRKVLDLNLNDTLSEDSDLKKLFLNWKTDLF